MTDDGSRVRAAWRPNACVACAADRPTGMGAMIGSRPSNLNRSVEELARDARAGSRGAFEELADRLRPAVLAHLARRGGWDDAEDICQETLLRVHDRLDGYDASRPLLPWVLAIASNVAASAARKRRRQPTAAPLDPAVPADPQAEPWRAAAVAERKRNLWRTARNVLGEREYKALRLFYAEGASVVSAAQTMGISRIHVKVLLHRARKKLLQVPRLREEV